jgi:hypothetical protein
MSSRSYFVRSIITTLVCLYAAAHLCSAQQPKLTPYKASGIYTVGEKVGWTADLAQGAAQGGGYAYTVKKNNQDVIKTGTLDFPAGRNTIEVVLNEPAMVYVQITNAGTGGDMTVGAAVTPEKLQPSVPRPADFDSFWASKIKELKGGCRECRPHSL